MTERAIPSNVVSDWCLDCRKPAEYECMVGLAHSTVCRPQNGWEGCNCHACSQVLEQAMKEST